MEWSRRLYQRRRKSTWKLNTNQWTFYSNRQVNIPTTPLNWAFDCIHQHFSPSQITIILHIQNKWINKFRIDINSPPLPSQARWAYCWCGGWRGQSQSSPQARVRLQCGVLEDCWYSVQWESLLHAPAKKTNPGVITVIQTGCLLITAQL